MVRLKLIALLTIVSILIRRIVSSSKASFSFFICVLALTLAYRIQLTAGLFTNTIKPFDFNPITSPVWFMLSCLPYDLALALGCFSLSWLLSRTQLLMKKEKIFLFFRASGFVFLNLVLVLLPLVYVAHMRLLFNAHTGLDTSIIVETFFNVSFIELHRFIDLRDYLFLFIPIGFFWLVFFTPPVLKMWAAGLTFLSILFLPSIFIHAAHHPINPIPVEIRLNPVLFLLSDVVQQASLMPPSERQSLKKGMEEESGIQPMGGIYKKQMKTIKYLPPENAYPWNIVFFIMESVGTRYMFDTRDGNPMPMPFLHRISQQGWHFKRHYTSSNISTKAIFSLLSGLYDFFNRETFGIRSDASVPSLFHFFDKRYDGFLVTPSPITWYFPMAFAKNSGLTEMHHFENLNFRIKEEFHSLGRYIGRDEVQTVDFFIERMNKAREPFVGIYLSFTAHLPYFDYGREYHVREDDGSSINRYYNNLNLLDHMIKRIYDNLEKQGLMERTIFVIVGDHGQAFGQHHPDNYMHYRYSYNENLETPVILYQPALFKPRAVEFPTSHVDLLPTLLDAMRIPYDPALFDGESLFHNRLKRRYIFFYGHEGSISSLDDNHIKVQYSFKKDRCWVFDLKRDPGEKNPLDCGSYQPQREALQNFVSYHDSTLLKYNTCILEKRDFQGHRHPSY
jgi:hypothetical protein